jgi:putative ABC transport system permease protein
VTRRSPAHRLPGPSEGRFGFGGFAWRVLFHNTRRTMVATSGIAFAIVFMFLQLGLYGAVVSSAVVVSSRLDADLVIVSSRFIHLHEPGSLPRSRLVQARAVPAVERVTPFYFRNNGPWNDPDTQVRCTMVSMAFPPEDGLPLRLSQASSPSILRQQGSLLVDSLTQSRCGNLAPGRDVELRGQRATINGSFVLGVSFFGDGALLMSDQSYSRFFGHSLEQVHLGLVKLQPNADVAATAERLRQVLPSDSQVLTREDLDALQIQHWVRDTAVGRMFTLGTFFGFLVGLVVLYQVLSHHVRNHVTEYATLKAMGYTDRQLYRSIVEQCWTFAALGFVPAFLLSIGMYGVLAGATSLPIFMTVQRALGTLLLTVLMCTSSGILIFGKIRHTDPAELF